MKKKMIVYVCMICLLALSVTGCKKAVGTPEDNAVPEEQEEEEIVTYKYGFSGIDMGNPYYITLEASIRESVARNGSTMITKNPSNDAMLQETQIREMIAEGIEFLFLSPVDWEAITPILEELEDADIEVLNIDTEVKEIDKVAAFIGTDNKSAGVLCGEHLVEQQKDGGKVAIIESASVNSISNRIMGFEEAIAGHGFEVVARKEAGGDRQQAKEAAVEILASNQTLTAIMCGNDPMALGVLDALKESGRKDVVVYSVDGSPELKQALAERESFIAAIAGQSPINLGKTASKTSKYILEKRSFERTTLEDTFLITKDNLDMYGVDGWQ